MRNLLGDNPDPKLVENLSNELQVTAQTPPTFIFHTTNDNGVPVENSVRFYLALRKAKVPVEMHLFENGPHGVGMALYRSVTQRVAQPTDELVKRARAAYEAAITQPGSAIRDPKLRDRIPHLGSRTTDHRGTIQYSVNIR